MKINCKKTKAMLFNTKTKTDFLHQLSLRDGSSIKLVDKMKLLGVIITSDLKWKKNTKKKHYK